MTFGERLKETRKTKNMSLKELSAKSGISIVTLVSYEKDRIVPKSNMIGKLSTALNCDYENLYELAIRKE